MTNKPTKAEKELSKLMVTCGRTQHRLNKICKRCEKIYREYPPVKALLKKTIKAVLKEVELEEKYPEKRGDVMRFRGYRQAISDQKKAHKKYD